MIRGKAVLAGLLFPIVLAVAVYELVLHHHSITGERVQAVFRDANLLAPGDDVRIQGTNVGSVATMQLTNRGTVLVTLDVAKGTPVRADATASVRQADLLGDVYLDLDPGNALAPLRGSIPASRTFVATHVQDLFNTFTTPTRIALQTLIVELGTALDARGADLNRAVEELAPALGEVQRISDQLGSQDAQLGQLIDSAQALTAQLAPRSGDIKRLISGVNRTLQITAARTPELDRGLAALPATLVQARTTLAQLGATATAATPLASDLGAVAPPLATAVESVGPFVSDARPALTQLAPLLRLAAETLHGGRQGLSLLGGAVARLRSVTPPTVALVKVLDPVIAWGIEGIFGGLGGFAAEPGTGGRNYFRGELVLGCEMFGIPTHPGCLTEALQQAAGLPASALPAAAAGLAQEHVRGPVHASPTTTAPTPAQPPPSQSPTRPSGPVSKVVQQLNQLTGAVSGALSGSPPSKPLGQLLNYLLKP
jgi:phospholipid/cholesterol/gamma-HCH transport system substrate-binding protein